MCFLSFILTPRVAAGSSVRFRPVRFGGCRTVGGTEAPEIETWQLTTTSKLAGELGPVSGQDFQNKSLK